MEIEISSWDVLSMHATQIRHAVFCVEQGVPVELELDEMDALSLHALARINGEPLGTARLLPIHHGEAHIGRLAVYAGARKQGIGAALLRALIDRALNQGALTIVLNAQLQAQDFYRAYEFQAEGEPFLDAGIPHIAMRYNARLTK